MGGQVGACAHTARGAARWTLRITGHTHDAGSTTQHPHVGRGLRRRVGVGRRGRPCAQQRQKPLVWPPSMRSGHVTCCACRLTFVRIVKRLIKTLRCVRGMCRHRRQHALKGFQGLKWKLDEVAAAPRRAHAQQARARTYFRQHDRVDGHVACEARARQPHKAHVGHAAGQVDLRDARALSDS